MKATLIDLFTSKKFLAALTAIIVYLAGRFGFSVDPTALDHIWQALLVYVGAQGLADVGKGAALVHDARAATFGAATLGVPTGLETGAALKVTPPGVTSSKVGTVALLALVVLGLAGAGSLTGCAAVKADAVALEAGVVTCAKGDVPAAKALGLQLGTEALGGLLMGKTQAQIWAQVSTDAESASKTQGLVVASCGFGDLVASVDKLLHPAPVPGVATQGLTASAAVDPLAGGRAALAAFQAAHAIARIDP